MKRSRLPIRTAGFVAIVALLALVLAHPAGAGTFVSFQTTSEPTPRPTPTPAPYLELNPTQGVARVPTPVTATGGLWEAGWPVRLYWDSTAVFLGQTQIGGDGTWTIAFTTPTDPALATVGMHQVIAISDNGDQAEAGFELIEPSPTPTSPPPTATDPPTPRPTDTPVTPSPTPSPSLTPTASATLRPITPMVTITPLPLTGQPTQRATAVVTRTATRPPGTPTNTRTPSPTPGPGTPSATPEPTEPPSPTPPGEITDTGGGWGSLILWGFVLAGLVVAFRLLRVRGFGEQS